MYVNNIKMKPTFPALGKLYYFPLRRLGVILCYREFDKFREQLIQYNCYTTLYINP